MTGRPTRAARLAPASSHLLHLRRRRSSAVAKSVHSRLRGADHGFGFYLDQVLFADQVGLHHDVGGPDIAEAGAVHAGDGVPVRHVPDVDARHYYVAQGAAEVLDRRLDLRDGEVSLCRRVVATYEAIGAGCGRAGDQDAVADAHGARIAGEGFPGCAAVVRLSLQIG